MGVSSSFVGGKSSFMGGKSSFIGGKSSFMGGRSSFVGGNSSTMDGIDWRLERIGRSKKILCRQEESGRAGVFSFHRNSVPAFI